MIPEKIGKQTQIFPYKQLRIFLVELPDIDESKKESYIRLNMNSYYPGDPEDILFRIRKISGQQHFLYLFHKDLETRICSRNNRSYSATDALIPFLDHHDFLLAINDDGYYVLKKEQEKLSFKFWPRSTKNFKIVLSALGESEKSKTFLIDFSMTNHIHEDWGSVSVQNGEAAQNAIKRIKNIFLVGGKSKNKSLLPVLTIAFAVIGFVFMVSNIVLSRVNYINRLQKLVDQRRLVVNKVEAMRQEIVELEGTVSLQDEDPASSAYKLLFFLAGALDDSTRIKSLNMEYNKFTAEAQAPDALAVVDQLLAHPGFSNIKITGITSLPDNQTVKFTITGLYYAYSE